MANVGLNTGSVKLVKDIKDRYGNIIIDKQGNIYTKNTLINKSASEVTDFKQSIEDTTDFKNFQNCLNLANNYTDYLDKRKFDGNLNEVVPTDSFIKGEQYYLLNYLDTVTGSFLTEAVDTIASSSLGPGSALTGGNLTEIELYILSNRKLSNLKFSTDSVSNLSLNKNNAVDVSNVNKIVIDGLKLDGVFEQSSGDISGLTLASQRRQARSVLSGYNIYVTGGLSTGSSVEKINTNNDTASGNISGLTLAAVRDRHSANIIKSEIYIIGGFQGQRNAEKVNLSNDTSLGVISGLSLAVDRYNHTSNDVGNSIYIIGSDDSTQTVEKLNTVNDTTTGTIAGLALGTARGQHTSSLAGYNIYVISGNGTSTIEKINTLTDTATGNISATTSSDRRYASSNLVGDYVYIIGGFSVGGYSVEKINSITDTISGDISGLTLASRRGWHSSVVVNSHIYVIAGEYDRQTVEKIRVDVATENTNVIAIKFKQ